LSKKFDLLHRRIVIILMCSLLGFLHGRQLISRSLSNLSAFTLLDIQNAEILTEQDDIAKEIRKMALTLDPNNWSVQMQEFRWLRATGQIDQVASWILIDDRFWFFSNRHDTAGFFDEYAWYMAEAYVEAGKLDEAVWHYYIALSRSPQVPNPDRLANFYRTLAQFTLVDSILTPAHYHTAGKLFSLAKEPDLVLQQAQLITAQSQFLPEDTESVRWANWVQAKDAYQRGEIWETMYLLQHAINAGKNPEAASLLLDLSKKTNQPDTLRAASLHLGGLAPEWELISDFEECVDGVWELAGFDLDEDILEVGPEIVADLYWIPQCNRSVGDYGLIDIGRYWLQPDYVAPNGFLNAGFEWKLPGQETTVREHPVQCCGVIAYEANKVLHVTRPAPLGTSAVGQTVPRYLADASYYVVGGRMHWGLNIDAELAHAILGGFWLDNTDMTVDGSYTVGNHLLQQFHVFILDDANEDRVIGWQKVARIIQPPTEAVKFSPWIGLSTGWDRPPSGVKVGGEVDAFFDTLFLFPVHTPGD
jgi:tetratricopeptide (TPR) repeat protein